MTKTDMQLKKDIEEELRWDPSVNAAQIAATFEIVFREPTRADYPIGAPLNDPPCHKAAAAYPG